jgi:CheY-like chemotaxis protein
MFAFVGLWLLAIADVAGGQEAPSSAPSSSAAQVEVPHGQESVDLLKAEIEHVENSIDATRSSMQTYINLLHDEAETSKEQTKFELEQVDRSLKLLYGTISAIGVLALIAGTVLTFLGIRGLSDVKKTMHERALKVQSEMEGQIKSDFATKSEDAFRKFEEMTEPILAKFRERMESELAGFETDLANTRDQIGKLVGQQVDRTQSVISVPGKSVIWVDDQPDSVAAPYNELKKRGVKVDVVPSTEQLKQKLKEKDDAGERYDLIISDIGRPGNDRGGLDYLNEIRDRRDLPKRLIFSFPRLIKKYRAELKKLEDNPSFLGTFSEYEPLYTAVFKALGAV